MGKLKPYIPEPRLIDRTRSARVKISPLFLTHLLQLPSGQEVVDARIEHGGTIELTIQGARLPPCADGETPQEATIIIELEARQPGNILASKSGDGAEWRLVAHYEHDPLQRWILCGWKR
jgi:hypothetical protein